MDEHTPFELRSMTATTNTFMSPSLNSIAPIEYLPNRTRPERPYPTLNQQHDSILIQAFTEQEMTRQRSLY